MKDKENDKGFKSEVGSESWLVKKALEKNWVSQIMENHGDT